MKSKLILVAVAIVTALAFTSCGSSSLLVPRAISTAEIVPAQALNLQKGSYDIMASVTETSSVTVKYSKNAMEVKSGDGVFSYNFALGKMGWELKKFQGIATFGYLTSDIEGSSVMPSGEEFARRVAISRLIEQVKDYGADGVLEPIVTTRASNIGKNQVEYQAIVTSKLVKIHPTTK